MSYHMHPLNYGVDRSHKRNHTYSIHTATHIPTHYIKSVLPFTAAVSEKSKEICRPDMVCLAISVHKKNLVLDLKKYPTVEKWPYRPHTF